MFKTKFSDRHVMALFDQNSWLGAELETLLLFIIFGGILSGLILLYFLRKEGSDSLTFKLIVRIVLLFFPIAWLGLSAGVNFQGAADSTDAMINVVVTLLISFVLIVYFTSSLRGVLTTHISRLNEVANVVALGDLRTPQLFKDASKDDLFKPFYNSFSHMLEQLRSLINNILGMSEQVAAHAEEIAAASNEVSSSSTSISSIMEHISQGTQRQVTKVEEAEAAEKSFEDTIDESFDQLFEGIEHVQEISEATNLLALNASIEAQRAGEYGRGFGIVASNVRRLAEDAHTYSSDIVNILYDVESKVKESQKNISKSISEIRGVSEEVASSSTEVSASTEEQAATLEEMSAVTQQLANLATSLESSLKRFRVTK